MKFTVKQKCAAIVALYADGKKTKKIHSTLEPRAIIEQFIFHTLEYYKKIG